MTKLTVVMISKNQAWNTARQIESVLKETSCVSSKEIVLVDSASTDETTDIARNYPITVLRLQPTQHLTPAAGRYIGAKYTMGEMVLFLDGDMELYPGWLEKALQFIQDKPDVAVITGQLIDLPTASEPDDKPPLVNPDVYEATEIPYGGGAALYRRSVLDEVGSFNPYLHSDEEPDLCIRIRHAGYRIIQLHYPIAYHYSDPQDMLSTQIGRWRRKLFLGSGQNIRYHLGDGLCWPYVKERGFGLFPLLGLVAGLINLLWSLKSSQWGWFGLWASLLVLLIGVDAYRKRSLYQVAFSLLLRLLIADGTIRGFLLRPLAPDCYPDSFEVIKQCSEQVAH